MSIDSPEAIARARPERKLLRSFLRTPSAMVSALVLVVILAGALFAPWIAPQNPHDMSQISLMDSLIPPMPLEGSQPQYPLGTDDQGRDVLSAMLFGTRISMFVSIASVVLSMVVGVALGLVAGWKGGRLDDFIMRIADVQLSFPAILIALLANGVARTALPRDLDLNLVALSVLIGSIALANWVNYARTARGSTLVEKNREYVLAARLVGQPTWRILLRHVLPNFTGPLLVIATINVATAAITEATLSFLGVGMPPTSPSLGTMINSGNNFLYSGEWWLVLLPGACLVLLCMSINILGDWLRDALNPRLLDR